MAESITKFKAGEDVTCHASAALTGGRFVTVSGVPVDGNVRVGVPAAAARVFGIAATDAASGTKVPVHATPGEVAPVELGGTVTAGDLLETTNTGTAILRAAGIVAAVALESGTSGNQVLAMFRPASL